MLILNLSFSLSFLLGVIPILKKINGLSNLMNNLSNVEFQNGPRDSITVYQKIELPNVNEGNCFLLFVSPTCPVCYITLEKVYKAYLKNNFKLYVFLNNSWNDQPSSLVENYSSLVDITILSSDEIDKIGVHIFPTIIELDQNKRIKKIAHQFERELFKVPMNS